MAIVYSSSCEVDEELELVLLLIDSLSEELDHVALSLSRGLAFLAASGLHMVRLSRRFIYRALL